MHLSAQQLDRAVGAVLASAAGDALGSQYEFGPSLPDSLTPEFGVGCFGHAPGEWTDDTSMAMPILRQLAEGRTLEEPDTISDRLRLASVGTHREGCRHADPRGAHPARRRHRRGRRPRRF